MCLCVSADDSLLRQDDIWMLDGDDPHEPLTRVPRPDHLDFLRITPPEDDIIGDTPYCPKLECTVSSTNTSIAVMHIFTPKALLSLPLVGLRGISLHSGI